MKEKGTMDIITSFTDILFGVIMGFAITHSVKIVQTEMAKSLSLYIFTILYMFDFWFATRVELDIIKKYRTFSMYECFAGGVFGVGFGWIGYRVIQLIIACRFVTVFFLFVMFDIALTISAWVTYSEAKARYVGTELFTFYGSKKLLLKPLITLVVMYVIYLIATRGLIGFAIGGVYVLTLISEIILYRFRSRTIYKLRDI